MLTLKDFLDKFGYFGCIDKNYEEYSSVNDLSKYPPMTLFCSFIIDGQEKHFLSQELKISTEMFTENNTCYVNISENYHRFSIELKEESFLIDLRSIEKDVQSFGIEVTKINVRDLLTYSLGLSLEIVREFLCELCDVSVANTIVTIMTIDKRDDYEIDKTLTELITKKFFGVNVNSNWILYTICVMLVKCVGTNDDRDSYMFKVVRDSSLIIYRASCNSNQVRSVNNMYDALKTGKIKIRGKEYAKMSSTVSRRTHIDALTSIRKIVCLVDENSPAVEMRNVHDSQKYFICPVETSDGKNAGLTKVLAFTTIISGLFLGDNKETLNDLINFLVPSDKGYYVVINGLCIGKYNIIRDELKSKFSKVSIYFTGYYYVIRTVPGRLMRPVIGKADKRIYLIDPSEQLYHIQEYDKFHPIAMVGMTASLIPFAEHSQSARIVFACNMLKQAIEAREMNEYSEEHRMLIHGQKPLVYSQTDELINSDVPYGVNLTVALMTYEGWNQEDSIIISRSAIDRGLFHNIYFKSIILIVSKSYKLVNDTNSFWIVHGAIEKNVIEIKIIKDRKHIIDIIEEPVGEMIKLTIKIYEFRIPEVGDKIASRHAQKSIIGRLVNQEDLPFDSNGITPDIIMNPHAIPSRMTIGQLLESFVGKNASTFSDATLFGNPHNITTTNYKDTEMLFDGKTGEIIETYITMGSVFYMALKPQVRDKTFSRYDGPTDQFSRQPTSGKARDGGLRIGEMELDALLAHGMIDVINELSSQSDKIEIRICINCKKRIHVPCPSSHKIIKANVPFSRVVTEDMLAALSIGTRTTF